MVNFTDPDIIDVIIRLCTDHLDMPVTADEIRRMNAADLLAVVCTEQHLQIVELMSRVGKLEALVGKDHVN